LIASSSTVVMQSNPARRTRAQQALLVAVVLCLESVLFLSFASDYLSLPAYLGLHLGLCALALVLGRWWSSVWMLVACTAVAGPFGSLIGVGLLVAQNEASGDRAKDDIKGTAKLSHLELLHGSLRDSRLRLGSASSIRPLLDVFIDGTPIEKLDALSLISSRFAPALVPALKLGLGDRDASVRVLSATVLAQQHNQHTRCIGEYLEQANREPDAPANWRRLGQAQLDYVGSGLLSAERTERELSAARTHLARADAMERAASSTPAAAYA